MAAMKKSVKNSMILCILIVLLGVAGLIYGLIHASVAGSNVVETQYYDDSAETSEDLQNDLPEVLEGVLPQ